MRRGIFASLAILVLVAGIALAPTGTVASAQAGDADLAKVACSLPHEYLLRTWRGWSPDRGAELSWIPRADAVRSQCEGIVDGPDRFVELSGFGELACQFLKRRQIWRTPRRGAPQLIDTIRRSACTAQHGAKQGFDFRVAVTAHHPFERHDRLNVTILTDQGMSQNEDRAPVGAVRFQ